MSDTIRDEKGRILSNPGFSGTAKRTSNRAKMTQEMLDQVALMMAVGKTPIEMIYEMASNEHLPPDIRQKSLFKIVDLVYPKAASVEVKIEDDTPKDIATIDRMIEKKLSELGLDEEDEETKEVTLFESEESEAE